MFKVQLKLNSLLRNQKSETKMEKLINIKFYIFGFINSSEFCQFSVSIQPIRMLHFKPYLCKAVTTGGSNELQVLTLL